jgi:hypothetical protein
MLANFTTEDEERVEESDGLANWWPRIALSPLALILLIQSALAVLTLHNSAFQDEALYIYAGRQILSGAGSIATYASYFSGYPGFYPALAGALDQLGGLEVVRLFSLVCMLVVTGCVYLITRRLATPAAANIAALLFTLAAPTLFLSRLATYDALALMLLALATVLAVTVPRAEGFFAESGALLMAPLLIGAVAAKYAAALFIPFILVLLVVQVYERRGLRSVALYAAPTFVGLGVLLWLCWRALTPTVLAGINFTTTHRQPIIPETPGELLSTILQLGAVMLAVCLAGLFYIPRRNWLTPLIFFTAALAAPLYHLHTGESVGLFKHMDFALFFAAPLGGYGLLTLGRRFVPTLPERKIATTAFVVVLLISAVGLSHWKYTTWPDTNAVAQVVGEKLSGGGITRCLCEDFEVIRYDLDQSTTSQQFIGPYSFTYTSHGQTLTGADAYAAAIHDGYFAVIELSFTHPQAHQLHLDLDQQPNYHLVSQLLESSSPGAYFLVWDNSAS